MVAKYYLARRPQINDRHLVHHESCPFLTETNNNIYLGSFSSGEQALHEGAKYFSKTTCCRFCLKEHFENKKVALIEESIAMTIAAAVDLVSQEQVFKLYYLLN
jgi:hypothetical protein